MKNRITLTLTAAATTLLTLTACSGEENGLNEHNSQLYCENMAEERTDDPRGIEFSGNIDTSHIETDTGWMIHGWVDYPNNFGGSERYYYECSVEPQEYGQVLVSLYVT